MDLSINFENTIINIRVAVLLKTKNGFIFEKSKHGYVFATGGRIKLEESSLDTATREVEEDLGLKLEKENLKLISMVENFFTNSDNDKVHEICFVYNYNKILDATLPKNFVEIKTEEFDNFDIRPNIFKQILKGEEFENFVLK